MKDSRTLGVINAILHGGIEQYDSPAVPMPVLRDMAEEIERLTAELDDAVEALQELEDWQSGPPLESKEWLDGWNEAMKKTRAVLQKHEGKR